MEQINSKILLFGEYAILRKGMALIIPCDKYNGYFDFYEPTLNKNEANYSSTAVQSNEFLKRFSTFVAEHMSEEFVLEVKELEREIAQGLFFRSTIPQGYGLGSSGAVVAAIVLRYLKKAKEFKDEFKALTFQKLQELKKHLSELEGFFHGISSGLDPLSILLNEPILYKGPEDIETITLPQSSSDKKNVIFLLNTKHSRSTSKMMGQFNTLMEGNGFVKRFDQYVQNNNNEAILYFLSNDSTHFYQSISDISTFQYNEMKEFFSKPLRKEVQKGLDNGDYFLKLCGAGGGGFILGFTEDWKFTQEKLKDYDLDIIYRY